MYVDYSSPTLLLQKKKENKKVEELLLSSSERDLSSFTNPKFMRKEKGGAKTRACPWHGERASGSEAVIEKRTVDGTLLLTNNDSFLRGSFVVWPHEHPVARQPLLIVAFSWKQTNPYGKVSFHMILVILNVICSFHMILVILNVICKKKKKYKIGIWCYLHSILIDFLFFSFMESISEPQLHYLHTTCK